jgi:hypothetical protein
VTQKAFEAHVLRLWVETRVPLTRANLQYATGATRKQIERWTDAMVAAGALELDSDADGEILYTVRGAARAAAGATSVAEVVKLRGLEHEVTRAKKALVRVSRAAPLVESGKKSVVASAALSFFLGPVGWLYAAPLREALPAIVGFILAYKLLPLFLFAPLLGVLLPVSALAGAAYALTHNRKGDRASLRDAARELTRAKHD